MSRFIALGLAVAAGTVLGATAINHLQAQTKGPGAYAIVDVSEVTNPELMKTIGPKAAPAVTAAGGQIIARTDKIAALDGEPPKRFVIIAFDSMDQAKAWYSSPLQQEVNAIVKQSQKSRMFAVEGISK